ncbi:MAG: hypothetical protein ABSF23_04130 [Terracidiphilus sp.]|jgi:hypothetical protein
MSFAVACAVLGFNFLGDALRDHLDPAPASNWASREPLIKFRF